MPFSSAGSAHSDVPSPSETRRRGQMLVMEVSVKTMMGGSFSLRVGAYEPIRSVKAKIFHQEGIPVSQQHLIWRSVELEDDYTLFDYNVTEGASLQLVLQLRGGPINSRAVPTEDHLMQEMVDLVDGREDLLQKFFDVRERNSPVTLLVYKDGEKLSIIEVFSREEPDSPLTGMDFDDDDAVIQALGSELLRSSAAVASDKAVQNAVAEKLKENTSTRLAMNRLQMKLRQRKNARSSESSDEDEEPSCNDDSQAYPQHIPRPPDQPCNSKPSIRKRIHRLAAASASKLQEAEKKEEAVKEDMGDSMDDSDAGDNEVEKVMDKSIANAISESLAPLPHPEPPSNDVEDPAPAPPTPLDDAGAADDDDAHPSSSQHELADVAPRDDKVVTCDATSNTDAEISDAEPNLCAPESETVTGQGISGTTRAGGRGDGRFGPPETVAADGVACAREDCTTTMMSTSSSPNGVLERRDKLRPPTLMSPAVHIPNSEEGSGAAVNIVGKGDGKSPKKKKERCMHDSCNKKLGLASTHTCRCGLSFCSVHRYPEEHYCKFDYKSTGRKQLQEELPAMVAPKLPKI